ncbi:hypothetical protein SVIOM342S_07505 [Streptomyces violaceorubidus]
MAATRRMASHRMAARAVVAAVCAASLAGCAIDNGTGSGEGTQGPEKEKGKAAPAPKNAVRLIGDGSTAYTGAQPHLPRPERLKPGQKPPQFVVFSWDGAGEDSQKLFSHFREVAKENNATMTYFLSGVYMLPTEKRDLYSPPRRSPGRSDIGFNDEQGITDTVKQLRLAWQEGNEIGTHFNGHFCGAGGGVGEWSVEEWKEEMQPGQAVREDLEDQHRDEERGAALRLRLRQGAVSAPAPRAWRARRTSWRPRSQMGFRYDSSGANNQVPAVARRRGCGTCRCSSCRSRATRTSSSPWTTNYMVNQSGTATQGGRRQARVLGRPDRGQPAQGLRTGLRREPRAVDASATTSRRWNGRHLHARRGGGRRTRVRQGRRAASARHGSCAGLAGARTAEGPNRNLPGRTASACPKGWSGAFRRPRDRRPRPWIAGDRLAGADSDARPAAGAGGVARTEAGDLPRPCGANGASCTSLRQVHRQCNFVAPGAGGPVFRRTVDHLLGVARPVQTLVRRFDGNVRHHRTPAELAGELELESRMRGRLPQVRAKEEVRDGSVAGRPPEDGQQTPPDLRRKGHSAARDHHSGQRQRHHPDHQPGRRHAAVPDGQADPGGAPSPSSGTRHTIRRPSAWNCTAGGSCPSSPAGAPRT